MWKSCKRLGSIYCVTDTHNKPVPSTSTPPPSMDVFHNPKHISSFLTQSWQITNGPCAQGWWEHHMQCVWRWRADESQAVVRNRLSTQLTMQLWEPSLTIWWHLVELFVSIILFNFIYACLRKNKFMCTPIMEFGFVQWINIYSQDEK